MSAGGRCGYCGGPRERIDITTFSGSHHHVTYGACAARCVVPECITCHRQLDTESRCQTIDCPLYGHRQDPAPPSGDPVSEETKP